jgi:hypothetical protein
MRPVPIDFEGYYQSIERCRRAFPDLRILTGVEFGQPISTAGLPPLTSTYPCWIG